jgi:hypothetical protein
MSIMDQVKKNLREWYSLAADRTGEMAKISVRMYDKYGISREIERQLSELGSYIYHAVEEGRTDFAGDQEFQAWIDRVRTLEIDLAAKVEEIDDIRVARQQKQASRERPEETEAAAGEPLQAEEAQEGAPVEKAPAQPAAEPASDSEPAAENPAEDSENDRRSD